MRVIWYILGRYNEARALRALRQWTRFAQAREKYFDRLDRGDEHLRTAQRPQ